MDDEGADRSPDDPERASGDESDTVEEPGSGDTGSPDAAPDTDGPGGTADPTVEESNAEPGADGGTAAPDDGTDDAPDEEGGEAVSQADLPPAGDPDADYGPDGEWEDPFPDVETEPPEVEFDDEADAAYPANPNVPEQDPSFDDGGAEAVDAAAGETVGPAESDGGYADPTSTTTVEGGGLQDGPETDQEMPLADHIEEMVYRLGIVLIVVAIVSGIVFPFGERIINFLWYSVLPGGDIARPRVYHPLGLILARLKVATLAGFVLGLPVFVYQTYLFMRPGLYPTERRYYLASVPTSLVLGVFGVLFAYFLVLPAIFTYFLTYSQDAAVIAFGLTQTFDLIVLMMGLFAAVFQIPLFVMLAIMMGLTTRAWLAAKRLYFWGAFLGIAFLFSPDPTGMAPILVAATMIGLFEVTLLLLRWVRR